MRSLAARLGCALSVVLILAVLGSDQTRPSSIASSTAAAAAQAGTSQLIYAAQNDGTIHVYDINAHHAAVKVIRAFSCCADVRGIAAAEPTHRLYVMYNQNSQGHVAAMDLLSE